MPSPFPASASTPGSGTVHLTLLPPTTPSFTTLTYAYPLKLLPSSPHILQPDSSSADTNPSSKEPSTHGSPRPLTPSTVPLLFLLTYGGGLLPTDHISLTLALSPSTRLTLLTQGSTKIYKPPSPSHPQTSSQTLSCTLHPHSALWYAPHPTQPFAGSYYTQTQKFEVHEGASLGLLDWVSEGRRARGEIWDLGGWRGRNEVWVVDAPLEVKENAPTEGRKERKRLLLRDSVILSGEGLKNKMENLGVFGTLILIGPLVQRLADFFLTEFTLLPRIGSRNWGEASSEPKLEGRERWRKERQEREKKDGVLWTVAKVRGGRATVVKFGARDVEGGREWLGGMLREEGTVGREFGPGGLMGVS